MDTMLDRYTDEEGNRKGNNNKIIYLFNDFPLSSYHLLPPPLPIPLSHPPLLLFFLSLPLLIHHLHLPFPPLTYILFPPLPSHPPSLIPIPLKPFLHLNFPQKSILPYSFIPSHLPHPVIYFIPLKYPSALYLLQHFFKLLSPFFYLLTLHPLFNSPSPYLLNTLLPSLSSSFVSSSSSLHSSLPCHSLPPSFFLSPHIPLHHLLLLEISITELGEQ